MAEKSLSSGVSVTIYYDNTGGMRTKVKFLKDNVFSLTKIPEVIDQTETWLADSHKEPEFELHSYRIFMQNREYDRLGLTLSGGVLIVIQSCFNPGSIFIQKVNP